MLVPAPPSSKQTLTTLGPQQSSLGQQLVGHSLHIPFLTWVHLITAPQMCAKISIEMSLFTVSQQQAVRNQPGFFLP